MDENIRKLLNERDALQSRLKKVEAAIDSYERWTKDVASLLGVDARMDLDVPSVPEKPQTPIEEFEQAVRDLFGRAPRPLKRTEVFEELTEQGVVIGGKEPLNTVASRLSRMKGIINLKGHGYWAEDRPYPPAGHPEDAGSSGLPFDNSGQDAADDRATSELENSNVAKGNGDAQQEDQDAD